MDEKNKKILLIIAGSLAAALLILLIVLVAFSGKNKKTKEVVAPEQEVVEVKEVQIKSFQDLQLIEETLASGKKLDENIGTVLNAEAKSVLKELGVSDKLYNSYKIYTAKELLSTKFVLIDDQEEGGKSDSNSESTENDNQAKEWIENYGDDEYIISESQGLAFLLKGREDENCEIQHARLLEDTKVYNENSENEEFIGNTKINIRKVEKLKYNVSIDYPENAADKKYAIVENEKNDDDNSEADEDDFDYDKLKWQTYSKNFFIEENVTIYTKYKMDRKDLDYTIGVSKAVPELILSAPTYEIVENDGVYLTFSSIESEYNSNVKIKVSYGIKQSEDEEIVYSDWDKLNNNTFKIDQQDKYYIKFIATLPNKYVTDSPEQTANIQKSDGSNTTDLTNEENVKSSNTNLKDIKINGQYIPSEIINELNTNKTASYNLSSASSVDVKAEAEDVNATVIGNYIYAFSNDKATVKLQIVAEDKTKSVVTLKVTRNSSSKTTTTSKTSTSSSNKTTSSSSKTVTLTPKSCSHNWQAATCTAPKTCTICGSTSGSKASHKYEAATCTKPKTCKVCGTTTGEALGHNWKAATCTESQVCKRCNATGSGPLGHSWQPATCTKPMTCSLCRKTEGEKLQHNWVDATCTQPKRCTLCNKTSGSKLGHKYTIAATCLSPKKCVRCGEPDPTGKLGDHKWMAATCVSPKTCSVCNKTSGDVLPHNWKTVNGVAQCSRCGKKA